MYFLRNRGQATKAGVLIAFGLFMVGASFTDRVRGPLTVPLLLCAGTWLLAWVLWLRPNLRVDGEGVHAVNWVRRVDVPWARLRGLTSRFGLHVVTDDAEFPIAAFPGSGGLSAGRDAIAAAREDRFIRHPWLRPSEKLQWASVIQARQAIMSAASAEGIDLDAASGTGLQRGDRGESAAASRGSGAAGRDACAASGVPGDGLAGLAVPELVRWDWVGISLVTAGIACIVAALAL